MLNNNSGITFYFKPDTLKLTLTDARLLGFVEHETYIGMLPQLPYLKPDED